MQGNMLLESASGIYTDAQPAPRVNVGYHLVSVLALLLILMLETQYSESLYKSSLDFIVKIQTRATDGQALVWSIYSNLGVAAAVVIAPFILLFIYWRRLHAFYYVVAITGGLFLMNMSKLWYH